METLTTVACFLLVLASPAFGQKAKPRAIAVGPLNTAQIAGTTVTFGCQSDGDPSANIRWFEYATTPTGQIISDGTLVLPGHPNNARYNIDNPDAVTFNLEISSIVLGDAGYYECQDSNAAEPAQVKLGAQLIIIEHLPNCSATIPSDGFVIEGEYHTSECTVKFKADPGIAPLMTWTGPEPYNEGSTTSNTTVWSGVEFTVDRSMDARNFQCKTNFTDQGFLAPDSASNAPTWQYIYQGNQMFTHWPPDNMTAWPIQGNYEIGQTITCWADANPAPTYQWQSLKDSELWYSQTFTTRADMVGYQLMRCTARNNIQGMDYSKDYYLDTYVNAPTTTGPTTTPATTTPVPPVADCSDLTGRWEASNPNGALCLTVDHDNDARLIGLFLNGSDTYWLQIVGQTREGRYDELGWSVIGPSDDLGVSSYAAECHACDGVETMLADAITRSTHESEFCGTGGNVHESPEYTFFRVPPAWPCSSSAETLKNIRKAEMGRLRIQLKY